MDVGPGCGPEISRSPYPTGCADDSLDQGEVLSVEKLTEIAAAKYGTDVPSDEPMRYCYIACVDNDFRECDPVRFDPPEIRPGSTIVDIDPADSSALIIAFIDAGGELANLPVGHCRGRHSPALHRTDARWRHRILSVRVAVHRPRRDAARIARLGAR